MAKLNNLSDLKKLFPEAEGTYTPPSEKEGGLPKQYLEAHFSNKGRGGKTVTIIKGFEGTPEALKSLAKVLKQHLFTLYCFKWASILASKILRK